MFLVVTVKRVQFLVGQNSKIQSDIVSFIAWLFIYAVFHPNTTYMDICGIVLSIRSFHFSDYSVSFEHSSKTDDKGISKAYMLSFHPLNLL